MDFFQNKSSFFQYLLMSVRVAGAAAKNESPYITVHHHLHHFVWMKSQTILT